MNTFRLFAFAALSGSVAGCALDAPRERPSEIVLRTAFDPTRSFKGDLRPSSDDELVLTAWASAQDNYAPAYSMAIAYRCLPSNASNAAGEWRCGYVARMLRTGSTVEERHDLSMELFAEARTAKGASEMREGLDSRAIQWLEANVGECPNGILAMDSVRIADWNPDIHYALQPIEDRQLLLHPAIIRVSMHGSYTTSTYEGWVLESGVPAAVQQLIETLEPCWRPAHSPRPWNRPTDKSSGG